MAKQINHPHGVLPCCSYPQTESMDPTSHSPSSTWPAWLQAARWDTKVIISSPMPSWYIHSKGRRASFWKPIHCKHALPRDGIMHGRLVECSLYLHPPCFHNKLCKHGGCNSMGLQDMASFVDFLMNTFVASLDLRASKFGILSMKLVSI
jgi:hypothetical protein